MQTDIDTLIEKERLNLAELEALQTAARSHLECLRTIREVVSADETVRANVAHTLTMIYDQRVQNGLVKVRRPRKTPYEKYVEEAYQHNQPVVTESEFYESYYGYDKPVVADVKPERKACRKA
jgi:hypothetical protein